MSVTSSNKSSNKEAFATTGTEPQFDIVISGGGLAGALMALSLAGAKNPGGQSLKIAIVEANELNQHNSSSGSQNSETQTSTTQSDEANSTSKSDLSGKTASFDGRVLALSHHSATYLKRIGAWSLMQSAAQAIKTIHISDRGFYGKARIEASAHNVDALGYVIEMSALGQGLLSALRSKSNNKPNITWFAPDSIEGINWQQSQVSVHLKSQTKLSAKLLIACDGANSICRQLANIKTTVTPYGQSALIANVNTAIPHNNVAFERFTEHGPIAMLPLTANNHQQSNKCSLVWTLPPEQAQAYAQLSETDFAQKLEHAFGYWLGGITKVGHRSTFPLQLVQANEQVFHRMALVGNASHTIHPIAGQGFNLGLRDVEVLSQKITAAYAQGRDYSQYSLLSEYAQARLSDHQKIIGLTDSLVTLFSNTSPPLVVGRNIGLKVFNYLTPLKKKLVNKTMGYE